LFKIKITTLIFCLLNFRVGFIINSMNYVFNQLRKQSILIPGEKVVLRSLIKTDLVKIKKWFSDVELIRLGFGLQAEDKVLEKIANEYYQKMIRHGEYFLAIEDKENNLIGFLRFFPRDDISSARVGIMIGEKNYWNRGCGTEAMQLLIKFLLEVLGLEKVELDTADFNINAQRCFEKVGFKRIGEISDLDLQEGSYSHRLFMELTREDYINEKLTKNI